MLSRRLFMVLMMITALLSATVAEGSGGGRRRAVAGGPQEVDGVVMALSRDSVTIRTAKRGDLMARLTPQTRIFTDDHRLLDAVLQVGDKVEARFQRDANDVYTAIAIEIETESDARGVVKSVSGNALVLTTPHGEMTLRLTPQTVVVVDDHVTSLAALAAGMRVEVEWVRDATGAEVALVIEADLETVEIEGVVTGVEPGAIRLRTRHGSAFKVLLTPDTRFRADHSTATSGVLFVGAEVEIEALRGPGDVLTALLIEVDDDGFHEIEGVITAVGNDSLRIRTRSGAELTVSVLPETVIRSDERRLSLSEVKVGDAVEATVQATATDSWTALLVEIETDDERFFELEGTIVGISGSQLTVRAENGLDTTIWVTATTIIRGDDSILDLSRLKTGDEVEIVARRGPDGSLEAVAIEIEDEDDDGDDNDEGVEIEGRITAIAGSRVTISTDEGDVTVTVDAHTVIMIDDHRGTVADLRLGQEVEVDAVEQSDRSLLAITIEIEDEDDDGDGDDESVEIEGRITAIAGSQLTIRTDEGNVIVTVDTDTVVMIDDRRGTLADLRPGQEVEVDAFEQSNGSLLAKTIEVEGDDDDDGDD